MKSISRFKFENLAGYCSKIIKSGVSRYIGLGPGALKSHRPFSWCEVCGICPASGNVNSIVSGCNIKGSCGYIYVSISV